MVDPVLQKASFFARRQRGMRVRPRLRIAGVPAGAVADEASRVVVFVVPLDPARFDVEVAAFAQGQHHAGDGGVDRIRFRCLSQNYPAGGEWRKADGGHDYPLSARMYIRPTRRSGLTSAVPTLSFMPTVVAVSPRRSHCASVGRFRATGCCHRFEH